MHCKHFKRENPKVTRQFFDVYHVCREDHKYREPIPRFKTASKQ